MSEDGRTGTVRLAASADGSTYFDGLSADNATGIVDQLERANAGSAR